MSTLKVRVSELVSASKRRLEEAARRCGALPGDELARQLSFLPQQLTERFVSYRAETCALVLSLTGLVQGYAEYASGWARRADADDDGFLTADDARGLPADLQEPFRACLLTARRMDLGALEASPRDLTPPERLAAQFAQHGDDALGYADAVRRAVRTLILRDDSPQCARALLREELEEHGPFSEARLDVVLRQALDAGTVELLPESSGAGGRAVWLFCLRFGPQSALADLAFYVEVDRASGRAQQSAAA